MPLRRCIALLTAALLSACTTLQDPATPADPTALPVVTAAPTSLQRAQADLAQLAEPERTRQALSWAQSYLSMQRSEDAQTLLETIRPRQLEGQDGIQWLALQARLKLADGEARAALALLDGAGRHPVQDWLSQSDAGTRHAYRLLRADALTLSGQNVDSLQTRFQLLTELDGDRARYNRDMIWSQLLQLPAGQLATLATPAGSEAAGWVQLARLYRRGDGLEQRVQALEQWRRQWPEHPAARTPPRDIAALRKAQQERPSEVVVLLPESGSMVGAAQSIRDGFMTAYYVAREAGSPVPAISFLDTQTAPVHQLYQQAVDLGAQLVVGPLDRDGVAELAGLPERPVPVLALNYAEGPSRAGLLQFGLAPEDEARQVAEQARREGAAQAGILHVDSEYGLRAALAFAEHFTALGGTIVAQGSWDDDIAGSVKTFLRANPRAAPSARRRQDLDMLFLVASPNQGRQVKPALNFHYAHDLPVWSISYLYSGQEDPRADADLNQIRFVEIPWLLAPPPHLRDAATAAWPQGHGHYERLFALGIDAFQLVSQLSLLQASADSRLDGVTGRLQVVDGRVVRELDWAVMRRGRPQPLLDVTP